MTEGPVPSDTPLAPPAPRRRHRIAFWLILSMFSAFFAEVTCGSQPFVFFNAPGWLLVVPLYGLHTLVLATIVWRWGRVRFNCLFLAGVLFGLYEAYVTKVLWAPPWNEKPVTLGGLAVPETIMLAFYWHAFMAFIVPLFAAERLLLPSTDTLDALGPRFRRLAAGWLPVIVLPLMCGPVNGVAVKSWPAALGSTLGCTGVLMLAVILWTKVLKGARFTFRQLLPTNGEFVVLALLLLGDYVFCGFVMNREKMPSWGPQVTLWVVYAIVISLFVWAMRRPLAGATGDAPVGPRPDRWRTWGALAAVFALTSLAASLLLGAYRNFVFLVLWLPGMLVGSVTFLTVAIRLFLPRRPKPPPVLPADGSAP